MTRPTNMGAIEKASRLLAQAFGHGSSWFTADYSFGPAQAWKPTNKRTGAGDEDLPAACDGMTICRRTETLEKAHPSHGIREHDHWKRSPRIAVFPRVRVNREALGAIAWAKLAGPLEDWLLLYALQDWQRWPRVERFALALRPDPFAVSEAASRILFPRINPDSGHRAIEVGMRKATYLARVMPAERMLQEWLHRAAVRVLDNMGTGIEVPKP